MIAVTPPRPRVLTRAELFLIDCFGKKVLVTLRGGKVLQGVLYPARRSDLFLRLDGGETAYDSLVRWGDVSALEQVKEFSR